MDAARAVLADTRALVENLAEGHGTVGRLLGDDALYTHLVGSVRETEATMQAVRRSAEQVEQAIDRFGGPDSETVRMLADAGEAVAHARDAMSDLAENTEALKRNWLFSRFFGERGFYNLDQLTRDEYRELFRDDRYTPLRIWSRRRPAVRGRRRGGDLLRPGAVRRLDEAMAELLDYPRDSPLVVEGYAVGGNPGEEFRRAQAHADAVRAYLVQAYRRVATLTGTMPIGSAAGGSPSGDGRWSGVALTMFVATDRLTGAAPAAAGAP